MANTNRRLPDKEGKIFIPYNIGGGAGEEHFINGGKLAIISALIVSNILFLLNLYDGNTVWWFKLVVTLITLFVDMYVIRLFVLDERYYYKLYKRLGDYRVTNPSVFWDIVSIQNTSEGALLTYSDLKTGMMVRLERDTITGKPSEFKETHIDAISDFYRLLNNNGYSFIQMNIMEQAGNDPRLQKLDELVVRSNNKNISSLVEMEVAYIKNITRATLYESEYLLIYTKDINKARYMATEINEFLYKILDGAYIGFRVMEAPEIMQFVKEMYGIKLFDPGDAMLKVFKKSSGNLRESFEIRSITYTTGKVEVFELKEERIQRERDKKKAGKKKFRAFKGKGKCSEETSELSNNIIKNNNLDKNIGVKESVDSVAESNKKIKKKWFTGRKKGSGVKSENIEDNIGVDTKDNIEDNYDNKDETLEYELEHKYNEDDIKSDVDINIESVETEVENVETEVESVESNQLIDSEQENCNNTEISSLNKYDDTQDDDFEDDMEIDLGADSEDIDYDDDMEIDI